MYPRCVGRCQQGERADAESRDANSGSATHQRQDHAFGQQLHSNADLAAPERHPHCDLPATIGAAGKEQVRHVGARDQQHEPHRTEEHEERTAHICRLGVLQLKEWDTSD